METKHRLFINLICFSMIAFGLKAKTIINGEIIDGSIEEIELSIPIDNKFSHGVTYKITPDSNGKFSIIINIKKGSFALLKYKQAIKRIFIIPNDSLYIKLSIKGSKRQINFNGKGANHNKFINIFEENYPPSKIQQEHEPKIFFESVINERIAKLTFLEQNASRYLLTKNFIRAFQYDIKYSSLSKLGYYFSNVHKRNNVEWQNLFTKAMHLEKVSNDSALISLSYHEFINVYTTFYRLKYLEEVKASEIESLYIANENILNTYFKNETLEISLASNILTAIRFKSEWTHIDFLYSNFKKQFPWSQHNQLIEKFISDYRAEEPKSKNHQIAITDKSDFNELISEYKSKVIYVDFWATWCGPCLQEFKYNQELKDHFKGKDVVFLYISIDNKDKQDKWRKYIRRFNLGGDNVILPSIKSELNIQGIPRYFIIDKDGEIVNDNALRPSDMEKLYTQIEKYL